jgi:hypothetical protein
MNPVSYLVHKARKVISGSPQAARHVTLLVSPGGDGRAAQMKFETVTNDGESKVRGRRDISMASNQFSM